MCGALEGHVGREREVLVAPQVAAVCHGRLEVKMSLG